jgi:hypothetical protein
MVLAVLVSYNAIAHARNENCPGILILEHINFMLCIQITYCMCYCWTTLLFLTTGTHE